jgi:hypothetical protein
MHRFDQGILGEETRGAGEADQRQRTDQAGPVSDGHVLLEPAHLAHVLLVMHGDDHRARRQEQQRFEERVRHQMEDRAAVRGHAEGHCHVTEL